MYSNEMGRETNERDTEGDVEKLDVEVAGSLREKNERGKRVLFDVRRKKQHFV